MNTEPAWTNQSVKTKSDAMDINGPTCLQPTHSTSKHNDTIQITRRLFFLSSSFLAARKYCEPLRTIHRSSHQVTLLAADVTLVGGFPLIRIHVYMEKHVGHIISLTFDIQCIGRNSSPPPTFFCAHLPTASAIESRRGAMIQRTLTKLPKT